MTICILGRQPMLSLLELEQVFGADKVSRLTTNAAMLDVPHEQAARQLLGGTVKVARALTQLPTSDWSELVEYMCKQFPKHIGYLPQGKITFGLSTHDVKVNLKQQQRSVLKIKQVIRSTGRSVRAVPNTDLALNSAQVLHNKLTGPLGLELLLIRSGSSTWIAQTVAVQDIESYSIRDRGRPRRDAKVGMLPPKLAQVMINLAAGSGGSYGSENFSHAKKRNDPPIRLLDPFCGTGVLLQEAALMGYSVYGTDIDERMVHYTQENLRWFQERLTLDVDAYVHQGDAKSTIWQQPFTTVVCESYLGSPFSSPPSPDRLRKTMIECNEIITLFLQNLATQVVSGSRHCIGVPAWRIEDGFKHLPLLDELEKLGYNRTSFVHGDNEGLIYHRAGQIVARELLVITRK